MSDKPVIKFVHEGKAAYPDIVAYKNYFTDRYTTSECRPDEVADEGDTSRTICWAMMGFYPRDLGCAVTIHDYRSLSVGRLKRTKDRLKRFMNADPDLRFFQNDAIRRALGFPMDERSLFLPMGVPSLFIENRDLVAEPRTDFVYIGSMLPERRCELMLDSFVDRFGSRKTFDLYGPPNTELENRYAGQANIRFHGLISQDKLPAILKSARVGVCYFPLHYPHVLQTPTKLMEYGALGMRVLANEHPQSRITAEQYGLNCLWGDTRNLFAAVPDDLDWQDNHAVNAAPMAWPAVIRASGAEQAIEAALAKAAVRKRG